MALGKKKSLHQAADTGVVNTENFAPVIYTGNGSTQSITVGFQPDLILIKNREQTNAGLYFDSVRGVEKYLRSDGTSGTAAEATLTGGVSSFDSNGFTHTNTSNGSINRDAIDYVAWCWKAGGTAVTGTSSNNHLTNIEESANPDAGFSIIKYTSNGTTGAKFNHGLNSAPELYIIKETSAADDWMVVAKIGSSYQRAKLHTTDAFSTAMSGVTNNVDPTDTEISLGNSGSVNQSGQDYIVYCFHSVDGYQKIGSYTGTNGTAQTITTGFQPRWVLIKSTGSVGWFIVDSQRGLDKYLVANASDQEGSLSATQDLVFTATGFTVEQGTAFNGSGTYIYLAIA